MNQFLTQLCLTPVDEHNWVLTAPLIFRSERLDRDITVPTGFKTDLASVPSLPILHLLLADVGKASAVVHDFLLVENKLRRETCDEVYLDALKTERGVSKTKAMVMHYGVSLWTWLKGVFS
jgi:hypothetical protein